jgi:ribokinase
MSACYLHAGGAVRIAVIGQLEWVELLRVDHVPAAGEIVSALSGYALPAGSAGVAAVQLARWGAESLLFTALGDDDRGRHAHDELRARGVRVWPIVRRDAQRRALTLIDARHERTIVTIGDRLVPHADDPLPWDELGGCDAAYVTGTDAQGVLKARRARVLVATSRIVPLLRAAGAPLDALVGSTNDPAERYAPGDLKPAPRLVVRTDGSRGGRYVLGDGSEQRYVAAPAPAGGDTYGAGDTFAAGLTFALAEGKPAPDAVAFAAARAAEVLALQGPYPR